MHRQPPSDLCTLPLSFYIHMEYLPSVPSPHLPSPTPFIFPKFCNSPACFSKPQGKPHLVRILPGHGKSIFRSESHGAGVTEDESVNSRQL